MSSMTELARADFQENIGRAKRYWSASRLPTGERQKNAPKPRIYPRDRVLRRLCKLNNEFQRNRIIRSLDLSKGVSMTNQQQIEFILEQIRKMREKNQPDMMEIWRRQQEEYRKHIFGERKQDDWSLYGYGTRTNKNGYSLYTY